MEGKSYTKSQQKDFAETHPNDESTYSNSSADRKLKVSNDYPWSTILRSPSDLASFSPSLDIKESALHGLGTILHKGHAQHGIS